MKRIAAATAFALLFLIPGLARADSVWQFNSTILNGTDLYNGMTFETGPSCNCYINGTVIVDDSYKLLAWDFTDGTRRLTQLNSVATFDAFGGGFPEADAFSSWQFSFTGGDARFDSIAQYGEHLYARLNDWDAGVLIGTKGNQVGGWSQVGTTATPEPSSLLLLAAGLGVLAIYSQRKRLTPAYP